MGFFSDLKEDLSQAVNELMPEADVEETAAVAEEAPMDTEQMVQEEQGDVNPDDIADILANLTGTTVVKDEEPSMTDEELLNAAFAEAGIAVMPETEVQVPEEVGTEPVAQEEAPIIENVSEPEMQEEVVEESVPESAPVEAVVEDLVIEDLNPKNDIEEKKEERTTRLMEGSHFAENETATDEKSIITEGMTINGDIISRGSLEVLGEITGNLDILGKLDVSGKVNGDSRASEIYAENAKIVGEVVSLGSVKIGQSSVIIGNVTATSAVIAGAVKGDIDVKGPVILDTSAIVMGNIRSKSVQINNGAVIEGLCSQCYAEVNPSAFFEEFKKSAKA